MAEHAEHFESLAQQVQATKLGMGIFLASEAMIFGALFALTAGYRTHDPSAFREGIAHNTIVLGSVNTGVLIVSSIAIAVSVHTLRAGRRGATAFLLAATLLLGCAFLAIKLTEYFVHFREGIFPGGQGAFYDEHPGRGLMAFWNLYFVLTGLHIVHLVVGIGIVAYLLGRVTRRTLDASSAHALLLGGMYWQLVDSMWMFIWPIFYLQ
jgi:cytochrome c oxidase subunit 3